MACSTEAEFIDHIGLSSPGFSMFTLLPMIDYNALTHTMVPFPLRSLFLSGELGLIDF